MQALRVEDHPAGVRATLTEQPVPAIAAGEVLIAAEYSSANYKDALAATGAGHVMKALPCVGGIDVAGRVAASADSRFAEGDAVLVTGYGLGVETDGGYAQYVRAPADWLVPLPAGLTAYQAMALGTAGFTAALAVQRMQDNGLVAAAGPVLVSGASGGVGSLAVDMLAGLGYEVVALSGKRERTDYLRQLGASRVLERGSLDMGKRPLEKSLWAGAVDTVGGDVLAWLTRTMRYRGVIAACGLAGGSALETTVMPFILRGVSLLGIDSVACPMPQRLAVWQRLAGDLRPRHLETGIAHTVPLADLIEIFPRFLEGSVTGRIVVKIA